MQPGHPHLMRNKDVDRKIEGCKRIIHRLERLRHCKAVFAGDDLITVMRTGRQHEKKLLRRRR
jgi:hypothetical protein